MIEKARGKAARRATPPKTSQVSFPSQIGATEFLTFDTKQRGIAEVEGFAVSI